MHATEYITRSHSVNRYLCTMAMVSGVSGFQILTAYIKSSSCSFESVRVKNGGLGAWNKGTNDHLKLLFLI